MKLYLLSTLLVITAVMHTISCKANLHKINHKHNTPSQELEENAIKNHILSSEVVYKKWWWKESDNCYCSGNVQDNITLCTNEIFSECPDSAQTYKISNLKETISCYCSGVMVGVTHTFEIECVPSS